jgi:acetyl/propionyl-CoA carboxylase alpha subunit/acetyl-CoA carboxylase carboxyltransferase component
MLGVVRMSEILFIANRGEPVARARQTSRRLQWELAGVVAKDELTCGWTRLLDRVRVTESGTLLYNDGERMARCACDLKADAVWPAWGFLSETSSFAARIQALGITWVGPGPDALELFGDKQASRTAALNAGLRVIEQVRLEQDDSARVVTSKFEHYPLLVKGAYGGGGKGQFIVSSPDELESTLTLARRRNLELYNSPVLLVEPFLDNPRHVELQVIADRFGNVVILGSRDCSSQRRFQKVIEEAPAPGISLPDEVLTAVRKMLNEVGYITAGTVEFLVQHGTYYFLEVNPRLQVEHPVTEETVRVNNYKPDLLELMLLTARGERLPFTQEEVNTVGHSIEARIYAEDVYRDCLPQTGIVKQVKWPRGEGIRVDAALNQNGEPLLPRYDSMIAKVIATAPSREEAMRTLLGALDDTTVIGVVTNVPLIRAILKSADFAPEKLDTGLIGRLMPLSFPAPEGFWQVAGVVAYEYARGGLPGTPERNWKGGTGTFTMVLEGADEQVRLDVDKWGPESYHLKMPSGEISLQAIFPRPGYLAIYNDDQQCTYYDFYVTDEELGVFFQGEDQHVRWGIGEQGAPADPHRPPTGGVLCKRLVEDGTHVHRGTPLYILECMKMETTIVAGGDGVVTSWLSDQGMTVERGQQVLEFQPDGLPATPDKITRSSQPESELALPPSVLSNGVLGYDLSVASLKSRTKGMNPQVLTDEALKAVTYIALLEEAGADRRHDTVQYLVKRCGRPVGDSETRAILDRAGAAYGVANSLDLCGSNDLAVRFLHALATLPIRRELALTLLELLPDWSDELALEVARWYQLLPHHEETVMQDRLLQLVSERAPRRYYELKAPPVAEEYWQAWLNSLAPHALEAPSPGPSFELSELPRKEYILDRWFAAFDCRPVLKRTLSDGEVYVLEAVAEDASPRLVVVANVFPCDVPKPTTTLPGVERIAIECYRLLRRLQQGKYKPNHVFISLDDRCEIEWGNSGLSVDRCTDIARRVAGFAVNLRIDATELFLNLGQGARLFVIRHVPSVGVVSRPPFHPDERGDESDREQWMDSRQHRLGKLVNRDRMRLIFDEGEFRKLTFNSPPGTALDVVEGVCNGLPAVVYANDFRRRGGALGEAEGRKLTMAVLYAYFTRRLLIGLHDGAGANVKESAVSLVWAGAYFGAIAITGGWGTLEQFAAWWEEHQLREEFETALRDEGVTDFQAAPPVRHLHAHVGAAVGMLVYGPSISSFSIMVDHPNVYRVLTGSKAVEATLGERLSNYQLGGARVHAQISGDVDVVVASEEQACDLLRQLAAVLESEVQVDPDRVGKSAWQVPEDTSILFPIGALKEVLDEDFFVEIRPDLKGAGAIQVVLSKLAGVPVVVAAVATPGAVETAAAWRKLYHAVKTAGDLRLPFILVIGHDAEPVHPLTAEAARERHEFHRRLVNLPTPRLALVSGQGTLAASMLDDIDLVVHLMPDTLSATGLDRLAHRIVSRFDEAWRELAMALSFGMSVHLERSFVLPTATPVLPERAASVYNMREFLQTVLDKDSFVELWPHAQTPLYVGFGTLAGRAVAIIADDPEVQGGAQTRDSLVRFTGFGRLVERFGLPVVEFNDSPAFMPGSEQEQLGIQGEGGLSLLEEVLTAVPRLAVTLRHAYGGRLVHANLPSLGPPRTAIALKTARMGVMGAAGAASILHSPRSDQDVESWKAEYEKSCLSTQSALEAGAVERLCSLEELRKEIVRWRQGLV